MAKDTTTAEPVVESVEPVEPVQEIIPEDVFKMYRSEATVLVAKQDVDAFLSVGYSIVQ